jgi:hypothetical protein
MLQECKTHLESISKKYPGLQIEKQQEDASSLHYACAYNGYKFNIALQQNKCIRVVISLFDKLDKDETEFWRSNYNFSFDAGDEDAENLNQIMGILKIRGSHKDMPRLIMYRQIEKLNQLEYDLKSIIRMAKYRLAPKDCMGGRQCA